MKDYSMWEADGRFGLSERSLGGVDDYGSLGRGGGNTLTVFGSAEARSYYIQADQARDEARRAARELGDLKAEFLACLTPTGKLKTSCVGKRQFQNFIGRVKGAA